MNILGIDKPVVDGDKRLVPISVEQQRRIAIKEEMLREISSFLAGEAADVIITHR